jgi:hypothetical protein
LQEARVGARRRLPPDKFIDFEERWEERIAGRVLERSR